MSLNKGAQQGLFVASGYLSQLTRSAKRNFNYEGDWKGGERRFPPTRSLALFALSLARL